MLPFDGAPSLSGFGFVSLSKYCLKRAGFLVAGSPTSSSDSDSDSTESCDSGLL